MNLVNLVFNHMVVLNPLQLILGGLLAPQIEAAVEYLKTNWRVPSQAAPYVATVLAFAVQVGIILFFHIPVTAILIGAIFTTAGACFWHELSTSTK